MGRENEAMLEYLDDQERFADVFNGGCFGGVQIVRADQLIEGSEVYVEEHSAISKQGGAGRRKRKKVETTTRTRDIKKRLSTGGSLRILAIENQNEVDYTMPWRHMNYDCLEYGQQIRSCKNHNRKEQKLETGAEKLCGLRQEDRLAPAFTLCVYHGIEAWNGPRCLKDMMEFGENGECWEQLFSDYQMHLLCINEITDFSRFQSPLRELFELLAYRKNRTGLKKILAENQKYQRLDEETAKAVSVLMGVEGLMKKSKNQGEETYNMCEALQEIAQDSRNEGINILNKLNMILVESNRMDDLLKAINNKDYRTQLLREFGLLD